MLQMLILSPVGIFLLGNLLENLFPHIFYIDFPSVLYTVKFPNCYTKVQSFPSFYTNPIRWGKKKKFQFSALVEILLSVNTSA